jgi:GcrA cell cycle regulator
MNAMTPLQTKILELWHQELSTPQIGERLGMEERNVAYQIKQLRAHGAALPSRVKVTRGDSWTPERVEKLKVLYAEGQSANAIARAIGGGLSRNAVIGKIHRMGLQRPMEADHRPRQPRRAPRPRFQPIALPAGKEASKPFDRQRQSKIARPPALPVVDLPPSEAFKPLEGVTPVRLKAARDRDCRWPIDGPGRGLDQLYCGAEVPIGTTWCPTHFVMSRARRHTA